MKAYKLELLILDFDQLGEQGIRDALEHTRYPNDCISPSVMGVEARDIGEWDDSNPLNRASLREAEYRRLFAALRPYQGGEK